MAKPKWYTLFAWGWTALFAVVLADVIFNNRTPYYEVKALPALVCGGAVFAVLAMVWRLWKKHGVQPEGRLEAVLVAVLLGGYWVLQLVFAFVLEVQPTRTWDFGLVFSAAQQYAQSGVLPDDYFSQFHNNAPMYLVLVAFFKVLGALGVQDVMPAALVCNTLCVNGALLLLYRVLRRLYGAKSALFGLAGAFLFLPFLLYGPIVYTDTVTLPFPIGALALWLSARERPAGAGRMLRCAGAGLLAAGGRLAENYGGHRFDRGGAGRAFVCGRAPRLEDGRVHGAQLCGAVRCAEFCRIAQPLAACLRPGKGDPLAALGDDGAFRRRRVQRRGL